MKINFSILVTILVLLSIPILFYIFSYNEFLFQYLLKYNSSIINWADENFFLLTLITCFFIFLSVILNIPGGSLRAIIAGYLFGDLIGGLIIVIVTTFSSFVLFLFYKNKLFYKDNFINFADRLRNYINQNEIFFLLAIRLTFIIPFFVQNIMIANLKVSNFRYLFTTLIGIAPTNLIYIMVGSEVKQIIDIENIDITSLLISSRLFLSLIIILILYFVVTNFLFFKKYK